MKLAFDTMGYENTLDHAIDAARDFSKKYSDVEFVLFGNKQEITKLLKPTDHFEIVDCTSYVKMTDLPIYALRNSESSMYKAIKYVADNKADGVLSAGSTACFVLLVYILIKTIPGIDRPGFMSHLPTLNGKGLTLLDVGANKDCNGKNLYQFALMGKIYCETIREIKNPTIGVINIGTEKEKGLAYHKEADKLISADKSMNYVGFVEPKTLLNDVVDLAVCDGYTGNITLKSLEGGLKTLTTALKNQYKKPWNWLGALFSLFAVKGIKKTFDYKNNAGALVIGLNKIVVKTHGSADYQQFMSSLELLHKAVKCNVVEIIKKNL